jgi:hypothetical protein
VPQVLRSGRLAPELALQLAEGLHHDAEQLVGPVDNGGTSADGSPCSAILPRREE